MCSSDLKTESLPSNLRLDIAQAGWVRSVVIGSNPEAFAHALAALKPAYASDLEGFAGLPASEQPIAEIFWMLHHPELSIDVRADLPRIRKDSFIDTYRDNWWCGANQKYMRSSRPDPLPSVQFLTAAETGSSERELEDLSAAGIAPAFFAHETADWATAHPNDPRNPEALALAVKSARYSCTDDQSSKYSARAFRLLHTHYPNSEWAKRTPYWFK